MTLKHSFPESRCNIFYCDRSVPPMAAYRPHTKPFSHKATETQRFSSRMFTSAPILRTDSPASCRKGMRSYYMGTPMKIKPFQTKGPRLLIDPASANQYNHEDLRLY